MIPPEFQGNELISSIIEEIRALRTVIDEIEDEFKRKGKKIGSSYSISFPKKKRLEAFEYRDAILSTKIEPQVKKITCLLQQCFPWAPEELKPALLSCAGGIVEVLESEHEPDCHVVLSKKAYPFSMLFEPVELVEFLRELYKPVYVCTARILNSLSEFHSSDLKEYDPQILNEALSISKRMKWVEEKGEGSYSIRERPIIKITCPHCRQKVYAYEDECPKCGFYLQNLALRIKKRLEIPEQWYEWDGQRQKWIAFFKCRMYGDWIDLAHEAPLGKAPVSMYLYVILGNLERSGVICKFPDHEFYSTYYSESLDFLILSGILEHVYVYALYGSSIQELKEKILTVIDEIKNEAEKEYESSMKIVGASLSHLGYVPRSKKDFTEEFVRHAMQHFTPPLDKHPVLRAMMHDESQMMQWLDRTIGKVKHYIQEIEKTSKQ
ncbi:MAG: hypothetical protein QXR44_04100 [Thermoproteota archaeon]